MKLCGLSRLLRCYGFPHCGRKQVGSISGRVTDKNRTPVRGAEVTARDRCGNQVSQSAQTGRDGGYTLILPTGVYTVQVDHPPGYAAARNVVISPDVTVDGIDFSLDVVHDLLGRLDDVRFSLESIVSEDEANQAVSLFSVVTLMLAGLSQHQLGNEEKIDILGVLNLYYGLQEGSLSGRFVFADAGELWKTLEGPLEKLAKDLDHLQSDVEFLNQEAKRQFNLGKSDGTLANVEFPSLFKRYVGIGIDPLLSLDIRQQEENHFFDRAKLAQVDELLKELKGLILQIVHSLSKYGTAATKRVTEDWARFERDALEVLAIVAQYRVTPDQDEKNQWAVLADLTNKNREPEVAPYVVLARHGGKLLQYAMQIYDETKDQLDNFDREYLRDLFQPKGKEYWTSRIKRQAAVVRRYPLAGWG